MRDEKVATADEEDSPIARDAAEQQAAKLRRRGGELRRSNSKTVGICPSKRRHAAWWMAARAVTLPRIILPGTTYLITRRSVLRTYLMRPDKDGQVQNLYWYTLAVAARRYGIRVHAATLMATHLHEVVTDEHGALPNFLRDHHRLLALGLKELRGWNDEVFDGSGTNLVELPTLEAVIEKIAYVISNCVKDGVVEFPHQYPGVNTDPSHIGVRQVRATRPRLSYFASKYQHQWPDHLTLELEMPAVLVAPADESDDSDEERERYRRESEWMRAAIAAETDRQVAAAHENMRAAGRRYVGASAAVRIDPVKRATTPEPSVKRNPTFATGGQLAVFFDLVAVRHAWRGSLRLCATSMVRRRPRRCVPRRHVVDETPPWCTLRVGAQYVTDRVSFGVPTEEVGTPRSVGPLTSRGTFQNRRNANFCARCRAHSRRGRLSVAESQSRRSQLV